MVPGAWPRLAAIVHVLVYATKVYSWIWYACRVDAGGQSLSRWMFTIFYAWSRCMRGLSLATIAWLLTSTCEYVPIVYWNIIQKVPTFPQADVTAIRQKIVWKSGMCTQNRGLNNLHRKSLLKISDVYTGFVEIGGRELRRSGIQIVIGRVVYS